MTMRFFKAALGVAMVVAIGAAAGADNLGAARAAVSATLKDAGSAQFKNVRARNVTNLRGEPMAVVCGEVNAKNSFGGYVGFAPWIYLASTGSAHVLGADQDIVTATMLQNFCNESGR
jgi:hypothetical protein